MPIDIRGLTPLLQVFDMPRSIKFYCDVLGFEIVSTSKPNPFHWALLRLNDAELMLEPIYSQEMRPPAPDPERVFAHADTEIYFGCPDVDAAYAHLRAKGINVNEPRIGFYGMKQLYITDPDGYILCFQWPATQQDKNEWQKRYGLKSEEERKRS
jgi:catechol 2,3-dioxygenase-like lactoylglutathione lyase family enzyme